MGVFYFPLFFLCDLDFVLSLCYHSAMNEVQVNIRMSKELKEKLEKLAEKENRSVNNLINTLLIEAIKGRKK